MTNRPNVIVLILDTLRPDFLSCYGSTQVETPNIDVVSESGVRFENAFVTGPGTPVSHASIFSGQYPSETGVTGQYISLPPDIPLLAEWLSERGYGTFGISGPSKMGSDFGYDRGFDSYFEPYEDIGTRPSKQYFKSVLTNSSVRSDFLRTMRVGGQSYTRFKFDLLQRRIRADLSAPFFALANLTTVHIPYDPPRPYKEEFTPGFSRPRWFLTEYLTGNHGEFDDPEVRMDRLQKLQTNDGVGRFLADPNWLSDTEIEVLRQWYAACVKYLDDEFGRFLRFYRENLGDDTILIVTSDHGEQLGEHGLWEHSHFLFDETMRVPLLMTGQGVPTGVVRTDLVSSVDLFDTICDLCELEAPDSTSGRSMFSGTERDAAFMEYGVRPKEFRTESGHGRYLDDEQFALFRAGRKGMRTAKRRYVRTSNGDEVLYQIPSETRVEDPERDELDEYRQSLFEELPEDYGEWPEGDIQQFEISDGASRNLEHLGYID